MRFLHTGDLHLGRRLGDFDLEADQIHILQQILQLAAAHRVDGILVAGDVYDRRQPSTTAVELFDRFLTDAARQGTPVFLISGNHDSPERLDFASRLLEERGIHIHSRFDGVPGNIILTDDYGPLHLWTLPFLRQATGRYYYPEANIADETGLLRAMIAQTDRAPDERHLLIAHQLLLGAETCDSESQLSIGSVDGADASVLDGFDYVALGHLHRPQRIGRDSVRYAGSPLAYSASEANQPKSVVRVTLAGKGSVEVELLPLHPLHPLRSERGEWQALRAAAHDTEDYVFLYLTGDRFPDAMRQIQEVYPRAIGLQFVDERTEVPLSAASKVVGRSLLSLYEEFYESVREHPLTPEQKALFTQVMETEDAL